MNNNFNNLSLVQIILKWKWHIVIITVAAALCGAVFSGSAFITPLYKSEAVAYPANINPYSEESQTEQMLQIISSQSIMDSIIEKYDLWTDYKIDKDDKFAKTYMILECKSKIKVTKTKYEAVSITVSDKDPFVACDIAKDILNFYDKKVHDLHAQKFGEVVATFEKQLRLKEQDIDSLKLKMTELGTQYGLTDFYGASREVTRGYINGSTKAAEMKDKLETYGAEIIDLTTKLQGEENTYAAIKAAYEQQLRLYHSNLTYSNIITEPFPADKKSYPVRWVIVALCGLGAFLLSIVAVFIIENRKKFVPNNQ